MRVYVPLTSDEIDRLCALAQAERRSPRAQAAFLLSQALSMTAESAKKASHRRRSEPQEGHGSEE
jgi:hypothetical protein